MSENLNNPNNISRNEALPKEEVRADFHTSDLISLDEMREEREAKRLAEVAHPQVEIISPTPEELITRRSLNLFVTRRKAAMVSQQAQVDMKNVA